MIILDYVYAINIGAAFGLYFHGTMGMATMEKRYQNKIEKIVLNNLVIIDAVFGSANGISKGFVFFIF